MSKYIFNPSILFYGRCEEALGFYQRALGGEIAAMNRFGDAPGMEVPARHRSKIIHAEFRADGVYFMASDGMPEDAERKTGSDMVGLSVNFTDAALQEQVFGALSAGGEIILPLAEMFWGAKYGMFVDIFGVRWELNYQLDGNPAGV